MSEPQTQHGIHISMSCLIIWCMPGGRCYRCRIRKLYLGSAVCCRDQCIKKKSWFHSAPWSL